MPTAVAVVQSMNHGGPYMAPGHPGSTAVGIPVAMLRIATLRCKDNVRMHRLPIKPQDQNPTGEIWQSIDDRWPQEDVVQKIPTC